MSLLFAGCSPQNDQQPPDRDLIAEGKEIFRYDTFGDETRWTDELRMHEVIEAAVDPVTALSVGLKVDSEALPAEVVDAIAAGDVDLTDPQTTLTLLKLGAVVGVSGEVETAADGTMRLARVGITCALCHSTVDDSASQALGINDGVGIGKRLDGWPNRGLNPGAIIAPAPPAGSFDAAAAERGEAVFRGQANCASCHSGSLFTDATEGVLHPITASAAAETDYALRSATKKWRTTPLRGIWQHPPYFHDGSAATLMDVVQAYDTKLTLGLSEEQMNDLVEFLKSL